MKARLEKLLSRIRGNAKARWPLLREKPPDCGAWLAEHMSGFTMHRDVAVRLKGLPVETPRTRTGERDEPGAFKIRLAGSQETHRAASLLVQQRYAKRGYEASTTPAKPNLWTFSAYDEGHLAGTITVRLDSSEGVAADALWRKEVDAIRQGRHRARS